MRMMGIIIRMALMLRGGINGNGVQSDCEVDVDD